MFYTRNLGFHMNQPAFLDSNLPICERVQDLLSRPILDEKVATMNHPAQGVPCQRMHTINLFIFFVAPNQYWLGMSSTLCPTE